MYSVYPHSAAQCKDWTLITYLRLPLGFMFIVSTCINYEDDSCLNRILK